MNKIMIVLFACLCLMSLFAETTCFTDQCIFPKWLFSFIVLGLMGIVFSIVAIVGRKMYWNFRTVSIIIVILCYIEIGIGVLQLFGVIFPESYCYKMVGSFDNPAGFASCLCAGSPFALSFLKNPFDKLRWLGYSFLFFSLIAIVLSGSRAGLVSFFCIIVFHLIYLYRQQILLRKRTFLFGCMLIIGFSIFVFSIYHFKKDSADGRFFIWKCTWEMIKDKPVMGHGIGAFDKYYMEYQSDYFKKYPNSKYAMLADNVKHPFNEYLLMGVQLGVVSWVLLIGCVIFLIHCYKKYPSDERYISLLVLSSIAVFSLFSYPFTYPFIAIITILCIITIVANTYHIGYLNKNWIRFELAGCMLIASLFGLCKIWERVNAELEWKQVVELSTLGETDEMLNKYGELMSSLGDNPYFLYNYTTALYLAGEYKECLFVAEQCRSYWADYDLELVLAGGYKELELYGEAEKHLKIAYNMCPVRFVPLYELMLLYQDTGEREKAIYIAREILKKTIKVNSNKVKFIKQEASKLI